VNRHFAILLVLATLVAACGETPAPATAPAPLPLDREAIGHYCQMIVADHPGPKAQIFVADRAQPVWFSSVRDGIAFTRLPEEPKNIVAFYVNDMSDTAWEQPSDSTWMAAADAWYVLGSGRSGGMGAPEAVPFVSAPAAEAFAAAHGGRVVRLDDVPNDYVLGEVATPPAHAAGEGHMSGAMPAMSMPNGAASDGHTSGHTTQPAQH
jgi:copper chaperone NosL